MISCPARQAPLIRPVSPGQAPGRGAIWVPARSVDTLVILGSSARTVQTEKAPRWHFLWASHGDRLTVLYPIPRLTQANPLDIINNDVEILNYDLNIVNI
jgi:hypothetical protein